MNEERDSRDRQAPPISRRGSVTIGRIAGIPIRLHWTFAFLGVLVLLAYGGSGTLNEIDGFLWIAALFACVTIHEISHCVVARRRGGTVIDILLLPIGGLSELSSMPTSPDDEIAISIIGPLTSLALGIALGFVGFVAGARIWPPTLFAGSWWVRLAYLNLILGGFNLLPALPMDGGRVLRAALSRGMDHLAATLTAGRAARCVAVAMLVDGFFYDWWLAVIALFVMFGAAAEEQDARSKARSSGASGPPRGSSPSGTGSTHQDGGPGGWLP